MSFVNLSVRFLRYCAVPTDVHVQSWLKYFPRDDFTAYAVLECFEVEFWWVGGVSNGGALSARVPQKNYVNFYPHKKLDFEPLQCASISNFLTFEHCSTKMGRYNVEFLHSMLCRSISVTNFTSKFNFMIFLSSVWIVIPTELIHCKHCTNTYILLSTKISRGRLHGIQKTSRDVHFQRQLQNYAHASKTALRKIVIVPLVFISDAWLKIKFVIHAILCVVCMSLEVWLVSAEISVGANFQLKFWQWPNHNFSVGNSTKNWNYTSLPVCKHLFPTATDLPTNERNFLNHEKAGKLSFCRQNMPIVNFKCRIENY